MDEEFDFSDILENLNPMNWGVDDYSSEPDFNTAFSKARQNQLKEFRYKGNRYNTNVKPAVDLTNQPTFNHAFKTARSSGEKQFLYKGKNYHTDLVSPEYSDVYFDSKKFVNDYVSDKPFSISRADSINTGRNPEVMKIIAERNRQASQVYLNTPGYFSITDQEKEGEHGWHDPVSNKTYISSASYTVPAHELAHKAGLVTNTVDYGLLLDNYQKNLKAKKVGTELPPDFFDYVSDPRERAARHVSTEYFLKMNGVSYSKFGEKEYDWLQNNYEKLPYDIKQLMELYGDKKSFINHLNTPLGFNIFGISKMSKQEVSQKASEIKAKYGIN